MDTKTEDPIISCFICGTSVRLSKLDEHKETCKDIPSFIEPSPSTITSEISKSLEAEIMEKFFSPSKIEKPEEKVPNPTTVDNGGKPRRILQNEEPDNIKNSPAEKTGSCPVCDKPFPVSKLEAHVISCLEKQSKPAEPVKNNNNNNNNVNPINNKPPPKNSAELAIPPELLEEHRKAEEYLKEKAKREEEDKKLALKLLTEKDPPPKANPQPIVPSPPKPKPKEENDEALARILQDQEREDFNREKKEKEKRDEELARKLFEDEERKQRQLEWQKNLDSIKNDLKTQNDAELAKILREKDELEAKLATLEAERAEGGRVAMSLAEVTYPPDWTARQKEDYMIFDVNRYTAEWDRVAAHFKVGMPHSYITRIQRIQNLTLWTWYYLKREFIGQKNGGDPNEQFLFHGSRNNAHDAIMKDGLDTRVANLGGAIGAGIYFGRTSAISSGYVVGGTHKMFLCRVVLGDIGPGSNGLRRPPEKNYNNYHPYPPAIRKKKWNIPFVNNAIGPKELYDSVSDNYQNFHAASMFVIFDNHQSYPEYLIHYN